MWLQLVSSKTKVQILCDYPGILVTNTITIYILVAYWYYFCINYLLIISSQALIHSFLEKFQFAVQIIVLIF